MIGGIYDYFSYNGYSGSGAYPLMDCMCYISYSKTDIRIYDITDKSNPILERKIVVDGNYYTSRLIESSDKFIFMVNYGFYYGDETKYIPKISDSTINNGEYKEILEDDIYYYDDVINYSYLILGQIDLNNPSVESDLSCYLGLGGTIYVSQNNIYVATYDYYYAYDVNIYGWETVKESRYNQTRIIRISLDDLKQKAATRIEGSIKDRYSLDAYVYTDYGNKEYLRIAASLSNFSSSAGSRVYVLDENLEITGKIDNIAPGESIYSVKFKGKTGSLVTFRQVDPYFNLDLSNPNEPKISNGLKEEGVSYYLHYIGDTNYTIGVGVNSETIGGSTRLTGLKISLYDNTSGEAVNIKTIILSGSCYSEIFYNPKALLYNEDRGLFAFTYEKWDYNYSSYYYYDTKMMQGLAVLKFDLSAEDQNKLILRGTLSDVEEVNPYNSEYYYNYLNYIQRGVQIGDYIYTISDKNVSSYDISTLNLVQKLALYEDSNTYYDYIK
jgi:uncharacterized secreted protein with C-terminal beta-propeller domain